MLPTEYGTQAAQLIDSDSSTYSLGSQTTNDCERQFKYSQSKEYRNSVLSLQNRLKFQHII